MSLVKDRPNRLVTISCNHCSEELGQWFGTDDFALMVSTARELGWLFHRHGGNVYSHQCPFCAGEVRRTVFEALMDDEDFDLFG